MSSSAARQTAESQQSLWLLALSPVLWSAHFILSYLTAAVYCAKVGGRDGSLVDVRMAIVTYTVVATIGIGFIGWSGWKRHKLGHQIPRHDRDTAEDRHRFLGLATFLLSSLSIVATLLQAMVTFFFHDCR